MGDAGSIADQRSHRGEFAQRIHGWDGVTRGQRDDCLAMGVGERAGADEQCACPSFDELCEGCVDLTPASRFGNDDLLPEGLCRFLHIGLLGHRLRLARSDEHGNGRCLGSELTQQFQPLGPQRTELVLNLKTAKTGLPITIMPLSEPCANAARARSISPASRTSTGRSSTPSDGASVWIAPN